MINIQTLKQAIDPAEFYRSRIKSIATPGMGGWAIAGLCPFHDDRRAGSFYVNVRTGAYKCHSCGASGGDLIDFEQQVTGLPFGKVVKRLAGEYGVTAMASPEMREHAARRKRQLKRAKLEEALAHELAVLLQVVGNRVAGRELARRHRALPPEYRPFPEAHWGRERIAAQRIVSILGRLYQPAAREAA